MQGSKHRLSLTKHSPCRPVCLVIPRRSHSSAPATARLPHNFRIPERTVYALRTFEKRHPRQCGRLLCTRFCLVGAIPLAHACGMRTKRIAPAAADRAWSAFAQVPECRAIRLPSLSSTIAQKPYCPIAWRGRNTLPPFVSAAATASSRRPLTFR